MQNALKSVSDRTLARRPSNNSSKFGHTIVATNLMNFIRKQLEFSNEFYPDQYIIECAQFPRQKSEQTLLPEEIANRSG
jgi:hypothetical protein